MTIPKRYEDLTVDQFQKLEALKKLKDIDTIDKAVLRLSILSGQSVEQIEEMPPNKVFDLLAECLFLINPLHDMPVNDSIVLGKKEFKVIKEITGYSIAQHKDFHEFLKANNNDYFACLPELLAICHSEFNGKDYQYIQENHFENVELFKSAKLKDSLGAVFFYSRFLMSYTTIIKTCLEESQKLIESHVNEMMNDQEFQTFLKDGGGNIGLVK